MMACHAVVQRILLESLGVVPVDPRTTQVAPTLQPAAELDMTPMFADDGLLAGKAAEVLRALEHLRTVMLPLGLRFSMLEVVPAAGPNHGVDLQLFVDQGCTVNGQSGFEALKSPIGSAEWCNTYAKTRVQKYIDAMAVIGDFKDRHIGFYLMKWCCNGGEINYLARTTPLEHCQEALKMYDSAARATFSKLTGLPFDDGQWQQVASPGRFGGKGMRETVRHGDAAYLGSWFATRRLCSRVCPHSAEAAVVPFPEAAWARIGAELPGRGAARGLQCRGQI
jgi:hypothetical protein